MIIINLSPHSDPLADLGEPDAGGQCVYEHQLAVALSSHGHTVFTFCRDTGQRPKLSVINKNYFIFRITAGPKKFIPKEELEPTMGEFVMQVEQYLNALEPNKNEVVIHAHYWDGARAGLQLASSSTYAIPMVWTPHSLGSLKQAKFPGLSEEMKYNFIPRKIWENYMVHLADSLIVSSKSEERELENSYAIQKYKIKVIKPGIDLKRLAKIPKKSAREKLGLPLNKNIVLSFGRLTPSKGYERVIRGFSALNPDLKKKSTLVICGGNFDYPSDEELRYLTTLQQLVFEENLEDQVVFLPALPYKQVSDIYNSADVFVSTALREPYGLTIQEAMASETPVVIDESAGCKNLVKKNNAGLIINTKDATELSLALKKILTNKKLAQKMGQSGKFTIQNTASWHNRIENYLDVYRSVSPLSNFRYYKGWIKSQPILSKIFEESASPKIRIFQPQARKATRSPKIYLNRKGDYENSTSRSF